MISAGFAAFILAGRPNRPANQFLAFFLLLIAGNQGVEAFRATLEDPSQGFVAFRLASVFAFLDPFILYYFASIFPRRNQLHRPWALGLVGVATLAMLATTPWLQPPELVHEPSLWVGLGWAVATSTIYTVVLLHIFRRILEDEESAAYAALFPALCVATIPTWPRVLAVAAHLTRDPAPGAPPLAGVEHLVLLVPALVVLGGLAIAVSSRRDRLGDHGTLVVGGLLAGGLVLLLVRADQLWLAAVDLGLLGQASQPSWLPPTSSGTALRWFFFGISVSMALLRHRVLDLSLAARRRAARWTVGAALLFIGLSGVHLADQALGGEGGRLLATGDLLILGSVVVLTQGFRETVDRIAARIYDLPVPGDRQASIAAYKAGIRQVLLEGGDPATDRELGRLQEEVGLDEDTAGILRTLATTGTGGVLHPGQLVEGRYRIRQFLGRGGSGRSFLAWDQLLERDVAIKEVIHDSPEDRKAVLHEARVTSGLAHPNVVTVHDVIARPGASLLVTEYLAAGSLRDRLEAEGSLGPGELVEVLDGVLAGLEAIHEAGIVHRDLKPANVLLTDTGQPKLSDFGTARRQRGLTVDLAEGDLVRGTPAFMAPEQRQGRIATPRSDLYAVGLLGRRCSARALPAGVEEVLDRALADRPGDRWSSASAMRQALHAAVDQAGDLALPSSGARPSPPG